MAIPRLPAGYRELAPDCRKFMQDHPDYERNVFIMTRFVPENRLLGELDEELRRALCRRGLNGVRADDRVYPVDQQLWKNVCVYMLCCAGGVAILEDRVRDEFNPNVALEYGFMRALDKPTLLLKDVGFRNLRADILGTLHGEFDITDVARTLPGPIDQWVRDRGLALEPGPSELERCAFKARERLLRIRCADFLHDAARQRREREDEFHYLGEEIYAYEQVLARRPDATHADVVAETRQEVVEAHNTRIIASLVARFAGLSRARP
jgi:hypothetical protein